MGALDDAMAKKQQELKVHHQLAQEQETRFRELCLEFAQKAVELGIEPENLVTATWKERIWGGHKITKTRWRRGWVVDDGNYDGYPSQIITTDGTYYQGSWRTYRMVEAGSVGGDEPKQCSATRGFQLEDRLVSFLSRGR